MRQLANVLLKTKAGKEFCENETVAAGLKPILSVTDAELEARIAAFSGTSYHPGGTTAMGKCGTFERDVETVD